MNPTLLLLLPFLGPAGSGQRLKELTSRLLPTMLPGPPGERMALAAIVADQQIRRQERQQVEIAKEAVAAGKFTDLDKLKLKAPALGTFVAGLNPTKQAEIFAAATPKTP
jgi:hypothetical protein